MVISLLRDCSGSKVCAKSGAHDHIVDPHKIERLRRRRPDIAQRAVRRWRSKQYRDHLAST
jgi:hypothetical protein